MIMCSAEKPETLTSREQRNMTPHVKALTSRTEFDDPWFVAASNCAAWSWPRLVRSMKFHAGSHLLQDLSQ